MNIYDSPHGIIISQTTDTIEKDGDIIYLPLNLPAFLEGGDSQTYKHLMFLGYFTAP